MPTIQVPEPFRPTLDRIASMLDADLQKVLEAVSQLPPHLKPEVIAEHAGKSNVADLEQIVQALVGLSITRVRFDVPLDQFVHDVAARKGEDAVVLEERLKSLLSLESIVLSAKAFDVQHEYEKVFRSARIISDVRTIFNALGTEATGAMIVHNLNVTYFHNRELMSISFALDDADITDLKRVLERAELKANVLEKLIAKTGLPYFESKA